MSRRRLENVIEAMLWIIGENPDRDGLKETPKRVAKAYEEMFKGYTIKDESFLNKTFDTTYSGEITIDNIPVYSYCEHHIIPFFGTAKITYEPKDHKVVGLSKINRLVQNAGRRLQTQEQLTDDIFRAMNNVLQPWTLEVEIECRHLCMEMRGINQAGSVTKTKRQKGLNDETFQKPYVLSLECSKCGEYSVENGVCLYCTTKWDNSLAEEKPEPKTKGD